MGDAQFVTDQAVRVRRVRTDELSRDELSRLRSLLRLAFPGNDPSDRLTEDDWQHALGGSHVLVEVGGSMVSHAAIVERRLHAAGRPIRTGYVEAVGTLPAEQGRGYGSAAMTAANELIRLEYELGALGTGRVSFYERLGWERWRGPLSVRTATGDRRTPDEEGYVFVLRTPATPRDLDLDGSLSCEWRPGDVW